MQGFKHLPKEIMKKKTGNQKKERHKKICDHLDKNVPSVTGQQVEMCDLRAQPSLHLFVHLVTCFYQLHSQVHVVSWQPIVSPEC